MSEFSFELSESELKTDIPVSLEACFTLTYWTIQTVDTLSAVFTWVVSAVRPQLASEFKTSLLKHPQKYMKSPFLKRVYAV